MILQKTLTKTARANITIILIFLATVSITYAAESINSIYPEDKIKDQISQHNWQYYKVELDNPAKLTIKLRKISDDVDLYVSKNQKPTTDNFICAPRKSGKRIETCRLNSQEADVIYIGIYGKADSDYQLGLSAHEQELVSWSDYK